MAGSAEVGSLRLILGMDAADFEAGVKRINSHMDKMAAKFGAVAGIAQEFASQFINRIGNAFQAVSENILKAISDADKLGDLAQSIGINVEALSRLQYAASLAGVDIEKFGVGVTKLSKALQEIAGGANETPAAKAFTALGISVKDAAGALLPTEEIIARIAEKFSGFADGANKTALAINIFSKSGATLIPFLNQGRQGIAELMAEADRLGITLTSKTAAALGQTNDNIDKLAARTSAMWKIIANDLSPALLTLTQRWIDDAKAANGLSSVFELVGASVRLVVAEMIKLDGFVRRQAIENEMLGNTFRDLAEYAAGVFGGDTSELMARQARQQALITIEVQKTTEALRELYKERINDPARGAAGAAGLQGFEPGAPAEKPQAPTVQSNEALSESRKALNEQAKLANEAEREGNQIRQETMTINEALIAKEHELLQAWAKGAINAKTYGIAMQQAAWGAQNAHAQAASKIMSNLSGVFKEAKGFAIAQAVINTYEAFTAALKGPPGPPWSYAIAASTLAAGFAQVANIKSTNPGSGSGSSSGATTSGDASSAAADTGGAVRGVNISLQGDRFSRDSVRELISSINEEVRDGAVLTVS